MALSRAHASIKAADLTELLLLNKHLVKHTHVAGGDRSALPNRNHDPTLTLNPR